MKRFLLIAISLSSVYLSGRVGCLHNSYEAERKYDTKEYHHVECSCPCEKMYDIAADGTCSKCRHRRTYVFIQHVRSNPEKTLNVSALKEYARNKQEKAAHKEPIVAPAT